MDIAKKIYRFIASMKTGLVLLGLIGLISSLGTAIFPDVYYRTTLFKLLLLLLFINMTTCTLNQISGYLKRRLQNRGKTRPWFRQIGILLLHSGIVLILAGGTVNSYYGQSAQIRILESDTADLSGVIRTAQPVLLHLSQFNIDFNPDGSPAQYYSHVQVLTDNRDTANYSISVNHPLNYGGMKAYQESFGYLVNVEGDYGAGQKLDKFYQEGEILDISGSNRQIKVYKYIPNFDPDYGMNSKTLKPDNPRVIYSVYEKGELLGIGAAAWGERIEVSDGKYVTFTGLKPFTVLKVKSDPGMPLTAGGGLMFMTGVCLALFFSSTRKKKSEPAREGESPQIPGDVITGKGLTVPID